MPATIEYILVGSRPHEATDAAGIPGPWGDDPQGAFEAYQRESGADLTGWDYVLDGDTLYVWEGKED